MNILSDNSLRVTEKGFDLALRLPWYRALPLSTVEIKDVSIEGQAIDAAKISLGINGKDLRLDELAELSKEYWFVLDSAYLHITYQEPQRGRNYEVGVTLTLYPPYIPGIAFPHEGKSRICAS
jgi:hypothetical protein